MELRIISQQAHRSREHQRHHQQRQHRIAALAAATALLACCIVVFPIAVRPASAQVQIIANGGFESGDFTGWSLANRPPGDPYDPDTPAAGSFVIDDADALTPLSGLSALGPATGSFYALSDMTAQGTHILLQDFTVPFDAASLTLSFDMYVHDWFGAGTAAIDPAGLDHATANPNQHARVDLLIAGAAPFATDAGSVVQNFYLGVDPEAAQGQAPLYRAYSVSLTGVALPGQSYRLRFGVVDNQFVLNQGVDNVSLLASTSNVATAAPEPGTPVLLLAAAGGSCVLLAGVRQRRRSRCLHRRTVIAVINGRKRGV